MMRDTEKEERKQGRKKTHMMPALVSVARCRGGDLLDVPMAITMLEDDLATTHEDG